MILGFAGTLEPMTHGHLWVIKEARELAGPDGKVIVFLAHNPSKPDGQNMAQRKLLIQQTLQYEGVDRVEVVIVRGEYVVDVAKRMGVTRLVRGIRSSAEFDYECQLQLANVEMLNGPRTLFLVCPQEFAIISSSYVRSFMGGSPVGWHRQVKKLVPKPVYKHLCRNWLEQQWARSFNLSESNVTLDILLGENHYGGSKRFYHNSEHLIHILSELESWIVNTNAPIDIARRMRKAAWFHDAVYMAGHAISDEELSAKMWSLTPEANHGDMYQVQQLIASTNHLLGKTFDVQGQSALISADLAILGQAGDVYDEYAQQIRLEYSRYDDTAYARGRLQVLEKLSSPVLFTEPYFAERYQAQALVNMAREMEQHYSYLRSMEP